MGLLVGFFKFKKTVVVREAFDLLARQNKSLDCKVWLWPPLMFKFLVSKMMVDVWSSLILCFAVLLVVGVLFDGALGYVVFRLNLSFRSFWHLHSA